MTKLEKNKNDVSPQLTKSTRLLSLDALRGFDMFWIISGEDIFHGLASAVMTTHSLVRNPTDWQISLTGDLTIPERLVVNISNQLHHSPWNGFTFYDMIFPLFIFIAGVSMPFSFSKQLDGTTTAERKVVKGKIYRSLIKRTLILIFCGMIVNGLFKWQGYENTRFASVLGRIALSCFFAAVIFLNCSIKRQLFWFISILLGYWAAMMLVPVPGFGPGLLTANGNLEAYVDRILLPGKLHRIVYDPEGLLSTIPAIASAMLGTFAGQFLIIKSEDKHTFKKGITLFVTGLFLLVVGLLWNLVFPINKNMWTSSFVLYAGGWSVLLLSLFYMIIDVAGYKKWSMPFVWIGMNSILIYMAAHGLVNFEATAQFLFGGLIKYLPEIWHQAFLWIGVAIIQFFVLNFLFKKKLFWKI